MDVLFLSAWYPYPPTNGSESRVWGLLCALAERHRVRLLTFRDAAAAPSPPPAELLEVCAGVEAFPLPPFRSRSARSLAGFLSSAPRSIFERRSSAMTGALRREIAEREPDLVIASQLLMGSYGAAFAEVPALLEEVELSWCDEPAPLLAENPWWRWRRRLTRRKLERWVAKIASRFRLCTAVSTQEAAVVERAIAGACPVRVVPNAIDLRALPRSVRSPHPDTLIYPGAVTYDANLDAVRWFAREVWPKVLVARPGARLTVTGSTRGVDLRELLAVPGLSFTGHLEDVRSEIARHWLAVVPLRRGGGSRVKILEAMALGVPVVATAKGAEGLDTEPGRHLLVADEPDRLARAVVRLLASAELRASLQTAGRAFVEERHDWGTVGRQFLALVDEAAGGHPPGRDQEPCGSILSRSASG